MIRKRIPFLIVIFLTLASCVTVKLRTADTYYEQNLFDKAIPYYQEVINKKFTVDILIRLADCYRNTKNYQQSEQLYSKIVTYNRDAIYQFYYAEALVQNGKYNEARKWIEKYLLSNRSDSKALNLLASCDSIEMLYKDSLLFDIKRLPFNGYDESNFSPVYFRTGIVYVSNRNSDSKNYKTKPITDDFNLFYAKQTEMGNWLDPEPLRGNINSIFNEGPCSFNNKFSMVYFTRNDNEGKKIVTNQKSENVLKIYQAETNEGEWNVTGEVSFNNINYSVGHPTLSPSGRSLIFVSDMPWGYGGTDLYVVTQQNGQWSKPENLGKVINSAGNEMFPFLLNDSVLYFASNGMIGIGGLDIYRSELTENGWSTPENLGFPINSPRDDFGFICSREELSGYFSSNRSQGKDNIFSFRKNAPILSLNGRLTEKSSGKPLKNISLKLFDGKKDSTIVTDADGYFKAMLTVNTEYKIKSEEKNYFSSSLNFSTYGYRRSAVIEQNLALEKVLYNKPVIWRGISFDKGSSELTAAAKQELNKLANILMDNPLIKIELSCHTDSRGNDRENLILSQARADKAAEYLFSKGIARERITAVGYGSQRLLNNCVKGVLCLEEDHQINIRTEIRYIYSGK
jgi:outer membrane protein OmpA-like peptidoglycan-associated protein